MKLLHLFPVAALMAGLTFQTVYAQDRSGLGDDKFQPTVGQSGKDVIWVPTNDAVVEKMLATAQIKPTDLVYDLGAGDGKIAIAAAQKYGANAVGIEYNKDMAELARRNAQRAGVANKVKIINGDIFVEDFSKANVVTLYLLPDLNLRLRPTILKMAPGTRVVSNSFNMGDWEPDEKIGGEYAQAYYWVVPANVSGRWRLSGIEGASNVELNLSQKYQNVGGTLLIDGKSQPIMSPKLVGPRFSFRYLDHSGQHRVIDVNVNGNEMSGKMLENMPIGDVTAKRM